MSNAKFLCDLPKVDLPIKSQPYEYDYSTDVSETVIDETLPSVCWHTIMSIEEFRSALNRLRINQNISRVEGL